MRKILFFVSLLLIVISVISLPLFASQEKPGQEQVEKIMRTYFNVSISVADPTKAQNTLYDLVRQYNGNLTNYNFDLQNNSGNASIQIPSDKVNSFLSDLKSVGQIKSSNLSTSDYTGSYYEYKRKLEAFEKFHKMYQQVIEESDLPQEEKLFLQGELSQLINSQITSYKSSVDSYAAYNDTTEISLQLTGGETKIETGQEQPQADMVITSIDDRDTPETKASSDRNFYIMTITVYVLFLLNIIVSYYLFNKSRKQQQNPYTS